MEQFLQIGELAMAIFGVASIVARITPTKKDDAVIGKVGKILNLIFLKSRTKG